MALNLFSSALYLGLKYNSMYNICIKSIKYKCMYMTDIHRVHTCGQEKGGGSLLLFCAHLSFPPNSRKIATFTPLPSSPPHLPYPFPLSQSSPSMLPLSPPFHRTALQFPPPFPLYLTLQSSPSALKIL